MNALSFNVFCIFERLMEMNPNAREMYTLNKQDKV